MAHRKEFYLTHLKDSLYNRDNVAFYMLLGQFLFHQKNYPELLVRLKIPFNRIKNAMSNRIKLTRGEVSAILGILDLEMIITKEGKHVKLSGE